MSVAVAHRRRTVRGRGRRPAHRVPRRDGRGRQGSRVGRGADRRVGFEG